MTCSVVCVLRSGVTYTPEHVRALYAGVKRWWPKEQPLRFVALTDKPIRTKGIEERHLFHPWRGWWAKMELFTAAQDDLGDILYFDLDTMIVGPLDDVAKPRALVLLRDFYRPAFVESGVMYLPTSLRPAVCAAFMADAGYIMKTLHGDGAFLDHLFSTKAKRWQEELGEEQILSYKLHVLPREGSPLSLLPLPPGARVVCFHGLPRPWITPLWERYVA